MTNASNGYGPNFPPAQQMNNLAWNQNLSNCGQNWTDNHIFAHTGHNCSNNATDWTGENLYIAYTSGAMPACDWAGAVNAWFNEYLLWSSVSGSVTNIPLMKIVVTSLH